MLLRIIIIPCITNINLWLLTPFCTACHHLPHPHHRFHSYQSSIIPLSLSIVYHIYFSTLPNLCSHHLLSSNFPPSHIYHGPLLKLLISLYIHPFTSPPNPIFIHPLILSPYTLVTSTYPHSLSFCFHSLLALPLVPRGLTLIAHHHCFHLPSNPTPITLV